MHFSCLIKTIGLGCECLNHQMPKLDESRLEGYRQWRLANTQLSCIGCAYIWQGGTTDTVQVQTQPFQEQESFAVCKEVNVSDHDR